MKIKSNHVLPEDIFLTANKEYTVKRKIMNCVVIEDDTGEEIICRLDKCAFLDGKPWTVVEDE